MQGLRTIRDTLRTAVAEWRAFGVPRYRTYQGIGVTAAATSALAGDGLTIPLLLYLGAHPAVATIIGVLPFACSAAQLAVPSLLRRSDGNLRLVTIAILVVGETRGFVLAAVTLLAWAEVIPAAIAIAAIAVVMSIGGAATTIGGTNLLAWYGAILPDPERRFVAPRVMGIALGLGAVLLVPIALLVEGGLAVMGIRVYAIVFLFAGIAGVMELVVVRRLPNPGRVRIAPRGTAPPRSVDLDRFIGAITIAAFGAGFGPYLSIYAIAVLGLPAGFAILLSALGSAASLVSSTIVGSLLARGSASRTLRLSFLLRGGSMILGLAAFPDNPAAWLVLCVVAIVASAGAAAGTLASNERLLRLTAGADLIGAQGRFVAGTAAGLTVGQVANGVVLALLPLGFPAFALLFTVSGVTRFIVATRVDVSTAWATATMVHRVDDFKPPKR
jgi:hypothetical protein